MKKLNLIVIGGGALAEGVYLPLLRDHSKFELVGLVENDSERAALLQKKFQIPYAVADLDQITSTIDAAIVATPNHIHKSVAIELLKRKIHVLIEKPLALTATDCEEMIRVSNQFQALMMVAMVRRYYENIKQVKKIIASESFGKLESIEIQEGYIFNWPVTSDSLINKNKSGGGVLMDVGVHVLDVLIHWLGPLRIVSYHDDSQNIEAECCVSLSGNENVIANVTLSRLRNLTNKITLKFENATVAFDVRSSGGVNIMLNHDVAFQGSFGQGEQKVDKLMPFKEQLIDFADFIVQNKSPLTSIEEAVKGIELIQHCYEQRQRLSLLYPHF